MRTPTRRLEVKFGLQMTWRLIRVSTGDIQRQKIITDVALISRKQYQISCLHGRVMGYLVHVSENIDNIATGLCMCILLLTSPNFKIFYISAVRRLCIQTSIPLTIRVGCGTEPARNHRAQFTWPQWQGNCWRQRSGRWSRGALSRHSGPVTHQTAGYKTVMTSQGHGSASARHLLAVWAMELLSDPLN